MNSNSYNGELSSFLQDQFAHLKDTTYLDNAGTAMYPKYVVDKSYEDLMQEITPSPHTSKGIEEKLQCIRRRILKFYNTDETHYKVVFTSGATAAIKLVADNFNWIPDRSHFVYADECHTSAVGVREIARQRGAHVHCLSRNELIDFKPDKDKTGPNLLMFPAMSNFCGYKFPLSIIDRVRQFEAGSDWRIFLDSAAYLATSPLDLSEFTPDFLCVSFYKMFGFPTGVGALLIRADSLVSFDKRYFGGGTVGVHLVQQWFHVPKINPEAYFEDGTLPFQQILSLQHSFDFIEKYYPIQTISEHVFQLAKLFRTSCRSLKHENDQALVHIYSLTKDSDINVANQGGIVNFNLLKMDGSYYGFNAFKSLAESEGIIVRTGCFCNIGACQKYLSYNDEDAMKNYQAGHVCGDDIDLINGKPVGSIRISFGSYSSRKDVDKVILLLKKHFLNVSNIPRALPNETSRSAVVSDIFIYPVKSCAPFRVSEWIMTESGFKYDRTWAVMRGNECLTQKKLKALCLIQPEINLKKQILTLKFPQAEPISLPLHPERQPKEAKETFNVCIGKVCNETMEGLDCGQDVSNWLREVTGEDDLKLVHQTLRKSSSFDAKMSLANQSPYLILNKESVRRLVQRIRAFNSSDIDEESLISQFRGNIVLDDEEAFLEDRWHKLSFDRKVDLVHPRKCQRCSMISIDQNTGGQIAGISTALMRMPDRGFVFGILFGADLKEDDNPSISKGTRVEIEYFQSNQVV